MRSKTNNQSVELFQSEQTAHEYSRNARFAEIIFIAMSCMKIPYNLRSIAPAIHNT